MINAIDKLGLVELPSQGLKYTWANGRAAGCEIKDKLDQGITNSDRWNFFPNTDIKILPQTVSNHSLVILKSEGYSSFLQRPFRFEAIWTYDRKSHWVVEHAWAKSFHSHPMTRLRHFLSTLIGASLIGIRISSRRFNFR